MTSKLMRIAFAAFVVLGLAAPLSAISVPPSLAHTKPGYQAKSERAKKPGETCENLKHDSAAYKNCVEIRAQENKSTGSQGNGKDDRK